jgi:hypothetical protein
MLVHTVARRTTDAVRRASFWSSLFIGPRDSDPRQRISADGEALDRHRPPARHATALAKGPWPAPNQVVGLGGHDGAGRSVMRATCHVSS